MLLLVFAILVVILGFKNFNNTIHAPFAKYLAQAPIPGEPTEAEINEALKNKDTDKDGLSDYDELNLYRTSPYLEDSDSDGLADGVEVQKGADPNCPEGKNCGFSPLSNPTAEPEKKGPPAGLIPPDAAAKENFEELMKLLSSPTQDPKELRQFLIKRGVKPDLLEKISDEELLKLFDESQASAQTAGFDAKTIRQELLKQGFDPKILEKISDEELEKEVLESLKETKP